MPEAEITTENVHIHTQPWSKTDSALSGLITVLSIMTVLTSPVLVFATYVHLIGGMR